MFIKKFASIAALSLGAIASISYAGSAHALTLSYDPGNYRDSAVTNQGVFSKQVNDKNYTTFDFNDKDSAVPSNDQVKYSFSDKNIYSTSPGSTGIFSDKWAPSGANAEVNTSKYLAVFQGNDAIIQSTKGNLFTYFGFDAGALSGGNTLSFFNAGKKIATYDFNFLNNIATVAASSQGNQKNGFFEFFSKDKNDTFDKIVISQRSGGGFESDNHTFRTAKVPEPGVVLGLLAVGGVFLRKGKNQKSLNLG